MKALRDALGAEGANLYVIVPTGGVVAGGSSAAVVDADPYTAVNLGGAFRHHKVVAAWGEGVAVLETCGIMADLPGVVAADSADAGFTGRLVESIGLHRHWDRRPAR